MVYEQPDSLKPVADKLKLEITHGDRRVSARPRPARPGRWPTPSSSTPLFGNDATAQQAQHRGGRDRRRTSSLPGASCSYSPAHLLPFAEVKDRVRQRSSPSRPRRWRARTAQARLAALRKPRRADVRPTPVVVSRAQPRELPPPLIDAVLRADADRCRRSSASTSATQGYAVAKIDKVLGRDPVGGRSAQAHGAVRAGLGRGRGAGVLRRAEGALQGRGQRLGDRRREAGGERVAAELAAQRSASAQGRSLYLRALRWL